MKHGMTKMHMATRYYFEKALRLCIQYIQKAKFMKRRVCNDKEEPIMHKKFFLMQRFHNFYLFSITSSKAYMKSLVTNQKKKLKGKEVLMNIMTLTNYNKIHLNIIPTIHKNMKMNKDKKHVTKMYQIFFKFIIGKI